MNRASTLLCGAIVSLPFTQLAVAAPSDCEAQAIRTLTMLKQAVTLQIESLHDAPPEDHPRRLKQVADGSSVLITSLSRLLDACEHDATDWTAELWSDLDANLPWLKNHTAFENEGSAINSLPIVGDDDRLQLNIKASRTTSDANPADHTTDDAPRVRYELNTATARFKGPGVSAKAAITGSIELLSTPTANDDGTLTTKVADLIWHLQTRHGALTLRLDPEHPQNRVTTDPELGEGTLEVSCLVQGASHPMIATIGTSLVLRLPISFTKANTRLTISTEGWTTATDAIPIPTTADPADFAFPPVDAPPLGDANGNGIPDFADQLNRSIDMSIEVLNPRQHD